jgi:lysophospholipase L1-like esterase
MTGLPATTPSAHQARALGRLGASVLAAALVLATGACSSPSQPTPPPDAPSISCPVGVSATSLDGRPVVVSYSTPSAIGGAAPVTVGCAPASGSTFAIGITTVTCTARDSIGRQASCPFSVQVTTPPQLSVIRFLAFGDSLTEGKLSGSAPLYILVDFPDSYPRVLQGLLRARYTAQPTLTVTNAGWGGEKAIDGVDRLPGLLADLAPGAVLLMEGANDLNTALADERIEPAAEAMREMVGLVRATGANAFLATLPPQRPGGRNAKGALSVADYNTRLRSVATQTGAVLVDVWGAFGGVASTDLVGADGLHLTAAGYQRVAQAFYEAIRERLEAQGAADGDVR